ncbi:molybdate ABC transporter, inner membrane subunit [Beutenbergia cavernae DSM 12333]|uniref:Molybdenum transport system permease n=1 Tax=Beutenbergia cavernae (strain ATCC BAA-8 / DSM 12333 / CCUG 43141 / JCM 11478 / NBRC 16432 / NCIMB 13614 / HKI 0122) TaxID=471853 RepID=C5C1M4_BEUC1|nr:ABC transporter permease [Beutenbergia cavernae]ACQ79492.1 molybdate ABC transporter, inner membrane subunit [Beutenbergia cavernae DSM 12333]
MTSTAVPLRGRARARPGAGVPRALYVPAALAFALLVLPVLALVWRVDPAAFLDAVTSRSSRLALGLSLRTSLTATAICLLVGVPLASVLARATGRWAALARACVVLPLVLPPTVGGIALLYLLGRQGLVGQWLDAGLGIRIPFTTTAVVISQVFVALPFLVLATEGAMRTTGTRYERVAATLGASRWTAFRRVTLPLVMPGLLSGTVLCFARALGEFGATALFAGNAEGVTRTMPLAIYTAFNGSGVTQDTAVALSIVLVAVGIAILALARGWRPGATAPGGTVLR